MKINYSYNKNGYVVIKNFFNLSHIKLIKKNIDQYLKKSLNNTIKKKSEINLSKGKINSIHTLYFYKKKFNEIYKNKKLQKILTQLLEKKIKLRAIELFAKPARVGLPSPMHQDNFYWNIKNSKGLTVWVCLDQSNNKNGGLSYIPQSHNNGILEHEPSFAPGSSQAVKKSVLNKIKKKFGIDTPKLYAGDICIHSCQIVHGSSRNKSNNDRQGFTMQFKAAYAKYDWKKINLYRKSLKKQTGIRK